MVYTTVEIFSFSKKVFFRYIGKHLLEHLNKLYKIHTTINISYFPISHLNYIFFHVFQIVTKRTQFLGLVHESHGFVILIIDHFFCFNYAYVVFHIIINCLNSCFNHLTTQSKTIGTSLERCFRLFGNRRIWLNFTIIIKTQTIFYKGIQISLDQFFNFSFSYGLCELRG